MTIAISGGNGEFGRAVIGHLRRIAPDEHLIATVRDTEKASDLIDAGVEVRPGHFEDSDLKAAFAGADTVFLNATFFGVPSEVRGRGVASAIDAAAAAGGSRIVLPTWHDLDNCPLESVADYRESEQRLREAGPEWTVLRFSLGLADVLSRDVIWGLRDGEIVAPAGAARATPAALDDLAEATAIVSSSAAHDGRVYEITGPDAVSWQDLADLATAMDGRDIAYRPVDDGEYRSYLESHDLPESFITGITVLYDAFRDGWSSAPTGKLNELLGRPAQSGVDAVRDRVAKWRDRV